MEQEKNIEFLLKVIKDFSKRFNNSKFMLVGNGSEMDNIKEFVKEEGLEDKVIITGLVPQKEVQNYYASGDILIQPSKSETQGLVALEAMASGMPVLAITATGTIDIVKDKETGYLLNEDIEEFYQKAQELFKNKELFEKMSQKSREEAFKYDYKNKARRLVEVYDKMIKENRGK
jgi:1,2-diacylglycerol 3-alpha-glucosyltransferase